MIKYAANAFLAMKITFINEVAILCEKVGATIVEQTILANEHQKRLMAEKIEFAMGGLEGKQLAILGLAFKPNTDDMRDVPSITILNELAGRGAIFKVQMLLLLLRSGISSAIWTWIVS